MTICNHQLDNDPIAAYNLPQPKPLWLHNTYADHIVKGNLMTLSARPKTVEQGEWIAHQVFEHYRNLWHFVPVIHDGDENGNTTCNAQTCPHMSTGGDYSSFTWLNWKKEAVEVSAHEYITLMQRWIVNKIDNTTIFPVDPAGVSFASNTVGSEIASANYASGGIAPDEQQISVPTVPTNVNTFLAQICGPDDWAGKGSGFPKEFVAICQNIFRQMFRIYSHLYWAHFIDPFYHLNLHKHLKSCFSHFILTATEIDMLNSGELGPMQPLIDLWAANGTFPPESKAYLCLCKFAGRTGPDSSGWRCVVSPQLQVPRDAVEVHWKSIIF